MKNLSDIVLEKLNLGKAKVNNAATDLESFADNHNVEFQHYKEANRVHDYIKINSKQLLTKNKADVELFIDDWFNDSEYKKYIIKRLFSKLKSDTHIFVQIISKKSSIILATITIYEHGTQISYVDNIDENICEIIYNFIDNFISEFDR